MKIDKKLNLVLPITRGTTTIPGKDGAPDEEVPVVAGYVYSTPIPELAFAANVDVIARTFTRIYTGGIGIAATRVAAMLMREIAKDDGTPEKAEAFFVELRRLSSFAHSTKNGWDQVPLEEAIAKKYLDETEASEVENALAFFIVASAMHKKDALRSALLGMASLWGALPTPSSFTEFTASLRTSTETANSGAKAASSVPR